MTDERLEQIDNRRPYMTCHDQKYCIDEIKRLRAVLEEISIVEPETAPEAYMVQEANKALYGGSK